MNPDQIADQVKDIYQGYYTGQYNVKSFWYALLNYFNLKETDHLNPEALQNAYQNSYNLYQDILDFCLILKKKYRVALLSNLTPGMRDYIRKKHSLEKIFEVEFIVVILMF
jgi:FMN phosphatase YigB (HAD superfamily)